MAPLLPTSSSYAARFSFPREKWRKREGGHEFLMGVCCKVLPSLIELCEKSRLNRYLEMVWNRIITLFK